MTKQHEALATFYDPRTRAYVTNHMDENNWLIIGSFIAKMVPSGPL